MAEKLTLWAWFATPKDGGRDYIVGWAYEDQWGRHDIPLVNSKEDVMRQAEAIALLHAKQTGAHVRLVAFDER